MTIEEAIKEIQMAKRLVREESKCDKAFDMAISALEKENIYDDGEHYVTISKALYDKLNVDVCEDTISREAVLKKIDYEVEYYCKYLEKVDDKRNAQTHVALVSDNIREEVEQLSSVTPSRPKGHWIDEGQYAEGHSHHAYRCSECGQHIIELPSRLMDENPHCKWCGTDMRGAE